MLQNKLELSLSVQLGKTLALRKVALHQSQTPSPVDHPGNVDVITIPGMVGDHSTVGEGVQPYLWMMGDHPGDDVLQSWRWLVTILWRMGDHFQEVQ